MPQKVAPDWRHLPQHEVLDALDTLRQRVRSASRGGRVHLPALRAAVASTADPLVCAMLDDLEAHFERQVSAAR